MTISERARGLQQQMVEFLRDDVLPAEAVYANQRAADIAAGNRRAPEVLDSLKQIARRRGLWNTFLPSESGLTQSEYAYIAELSGWSQHLAPEAINGQAPDTGNMELLHLWGTDAQRATWLGPLLDGRIRSAFAMTEPQVASSDATNISTRIEVGHDEIIVDGHKWWVSGVADPRCEFLIVMGRSDPDAPSHRQHSMVLVPVATPGVEIVRYLTVFGHHDQHGHAEVRLTNVRVPVGNLIGEAGGGFAVAQSRLGPGRIHHCLRSVGAAERALAMLIARAQSRVAFGAPIIEHGSTEQLIAESRLEIDQARLLCHEACRVIDTDGNKAAHSLVAMAKVAAPRAALRVIDRAIQVHGGAGVSGDTPLAAMWGRQRAMRILDGPDEVHLRAIARAELKRSPLLT